ncbi:MAG: DUF4351 domain-containing protein [Chloroflexi bacterium]|nr:DUF4351 domain-containing protein [Chloroflexota bacterium]
MRWDMLVLRESPWYQEILQEGIQKGVQQGLEQGKEQGQLKLLLRLLSRELGSLPAELSERIRQLPRSSYWPCRIRYLTWRRWMICKKRLPVWKLETV